MPGLVGIISTRGEPVDREAARAMRSAIQHRDWYKIDDYVRPEGTLAISRVHLGIINREQQPYSARGGKVKVFLHGDAYYGDAVGPDLLHSIYELYEKHGADFASLLNGSFVVMVVDEEKDLVLLANDRTGTKPMFYYDDGQAIYFGPEIKSLLLAPTLERKLNLTAVADFLACGQYITEHTLIEHVHRMDNATILSVGPAGVSWRRYWQFHPEQEEKDRGEVYYRETLAGLLREAVHKRLQADVTYGVMLSGGYDSRSILGCCLEERRAEALHTISWGEEENTPKSDCEISGRLAQALGTDHRFYRLSAEEIINDFRSFVLLGEGLTDLPESYDVFYAVREQQGVEIAFRGDECIPFPNSAAMHDEFTMLRSVGIRTPEYMYGLRRVLKPSYYQLFCAYNQDTRDHVASRCKAKDLYHRREFYKIDIMNRAYLNPLNYVKTFALESFTPYLDHDLLDFMSALPMRYRLRKRFYRATVKGMFPELFSETAKRGNAIDWCRAFRSSPRLKQFAYQELLESESVLTEFVDADSLQDELDAFFAPVEGFSTRAMSRVDMRALRKKWRGVYHLAHKSLYHVKRRTGKINHSLPTELLIMRLLILKVWGDLFLDYPDARVAR
jgi:asparagine synthetase B (glutamine-hydrolysing)